MCTLIFSYRMHPKYQLIFLGNRDEYKHRPSERAHFWRDHPNILAGVDLEKGGTWTGISKEGRIAFLTNYRNPNLQKKDVLSRGNLTKDFLVAEESPLEYLKTLQSSSKVYNPYNLVVGSMEELWYYSNVEDSIRPIPHGTYGLSNGLLEDGWPKVEKAKNQLTSLLKGDFRVDELYEILEDCQVPPDELLPQTGVPIETERLLSTIHIDSPTYGTIFKTIILVTVEGEAQFYERVLTQDGKWDFNQFIFQIK